MSTLISRYRTPTHWRPRTSFSIGSTYSYLRIWNFEYDWTSCVDLLILSEYRRIFRQRPYLCSKTIQSMHVRSREIEMHNWSMIKSLKIVYHVVECFWRKNPYSDRFTVIDRWFLLGSTLTQCMKPSSGDRCMRSRRFSCWWRLRALSRERSLLVGRRWCHHFIFSEAVHPIESAADRNSQLHLHFQ